jgi:hypothetical protein
METENAHEHTGSAEAIRPSLRNGFTAYFALSPVSRALLPPSLRGSSPQSLAPASGARTTRLRRPLESRSSVATFASTASHRTFVTTRDPPLSRVRRADLDHSFARRRKRDIFARGGGQDFADLPVELICRIQRPNFVIASQRVGARRRPMTGSATQSIAQSRMGGAKRYPSIVVSEWVMGFANGSTHPTYCPESLSS